MGDKLKIEIEGRYCLSAIHKVPEDTRDTKEEQTLVIMIHGFPGSKSGHNDLFGDLEFVLFEKGFHTLRFDLRGCGESDGKEEHFTLGTASEDIQNAIFWARTVGYKRFAFIGEGIGATLTLLNLDKRTNALVLLWPALDLSRLPQEYYGLPASLPPKQEIFEIDGHKIGRNFIEDLKKTDIIYALREAHAPTLILHGIRDKKIPSDHLNIARQYLPSKRIEITTFHDGQHALPALNHRKAMFFHIQQFLEKFA